jgi:hypothetical protein
VRRDEEEGNLGSGPHVDRVSRLIGEGVSCCWDLDLKRTTRIRG